MGALPPPWPGSDHSGPGLLRPNLLRKEGPGGQGWPSGTSNLAPQISPARYLHQWVGHSQPPRFPFTSRSRVSGSSLQGRNHSPTSPAFHRGSPQIPRACPTLDHTPRMVHSKPGPHEVGSSPSAPAASARALAHNRGTMGCFSRPGLMGGQGREERCPHRGDAGTETRLQTKLPGPRDLRQAPGNLLQGGVKDEVRPGRARIHGRPPPGDRRPVLWAPGPAPPGPASRIPVRHVRARVPVPRTHLKRLKRSLSPSKRRRKLRSEPCCSYQVFSFLNCGSWVSAAMA